MPAEARSAQDIEKAFAMMAQHGAGAVIVSLNALFNVHQRAVAEIAMRYRLPAISRWPQYVQSGLLLGYGPSKWIARARLGGKAGLHHRCAASVQLPCPHCGKRRRIRRGSLARPGGNVTGLASGVGAELDNKRLDLLRQVAPGIQRVGFLYSSDGLMDAAAFVHLDSVCRKLGLKLIATPVGKADDAVGAVQRAASKPAARPTTIGADVGA